MPDRCTLRLNASCSGMTDFVVENQYTLNTRYITHPLNAHFEIGSDDQ